jgi:hypothetical protein
MKSSAACERRDDAAQDRPPLQPIGDPGRPMAMKHRTLGLVALLFPLWCAAQATSPERQVAGNTLVSERDPAVTIKLPRAAKHVGADRWDLYEIADAELHVFVEANSKKQVKALYWIQFEAYLPSNTHTYNYTKDEPMNWSGREFYVRARFGPTNNPSRAGSDLEHVRTLLANAGYTLPAESMNVRLVHLLDEAKRKELMFIYAEDLAPTGHTSAQLMSGDQTTPEWEPIRKALIERAMKRIRVKF